MKKAQKSVLLPAVLEGLAKYDDHTHTDTHTQYCSILIVMSLPVSFAHLINLEFFDDLLTVLQNLIHSGVSIRLDLAPEQAGLIQTESVILVLVRSLIGAESWFGT